MHTTAQALDLDCIVFDVAPGMRPSAKPPVRIFLGTEEAQQRAQRVFLYSVAKHRDPRRRYHVYLMADLPGFDRRGWRTGFTNYRFAIPELAGGEGRAIYNDVDQIYLTDPAALFDAELGGRGYLAITPNETSVMVMDCRRMLPRWNLSAARGGGKGELVQGAAAEPGLWGRLDGAWNARDFEYRPGHSKLLHYTTLHLQPWRPTPGQYSYHPHPLGELWLRLEREAEAVGYRPFDAQRPSAAYRRLLGVVRGAAPPRASIPREATDFFAAQGVSRPLLCSFDTPPEGTEAFNPAHATWPPPAADGLLVTGLLERLPAADVPWVLKGLLARARKAVYWRIDSRALDAPADRPLPARAGDAEAWWREQIAAATGEDRAIAWCLEVITAHGTRRYRHVPTGTDPQVWVLLGRHRGDNAQLQALAEALGWPYRTCRLAFKGPPLVPTPLQGASLLRLDRRRSDLLEPPWPALVLACGRRSAPVARWIRRQSGGHTMLVHLGRPQAPLSAFDLVVTTPQYQLPARSNVVHNALPLNRPAPALAEHARAVWEPRLQALPRPWIALLAGGNSGPYGLTAAAAEQLRHRAETLARSRGGSLLIATSPRTPRRAADILLDESQTPGYRYRWRPDDPDNAYPAFLALADEFIVTADSASMLADACAQGRPVQFAPLPLRRLHPLAALVRIQERLRGRRGERGTPRQQGVLGRWLDGLICYGVVRPPRNLARLQEVVQCTGLAQPLGQPQAPSPPPTRLELEHTAAAVRRLLRRGRPIHPTT